MALLWNVIQPPGDGLARGYANQKVTRSYHRENFVMKIPMKDYGNVSSMGENIMVEDLGTNAGVLEWDHHNYASISALGVAVDGVVIYPTYNNGLHISAEEGELSAHGMHSGRGLGAHYHADGHSATGEGLNLYNASDYEGHSHPPIISIGFDGIAGYGIYQPGETESEGAEIPLDAFGGHRHGHYAYHYHAFAVPAVTEKNSVPYTVHKLAPLGAWAARVNDIPKYWNGIRPDYSGQGKSVYLGTE